jgi:hypothetical protein
LDQIASSASVISPITNCILQLSHEQELGNLKTTRLKALHISQIFNGKGLELPTLIYQKDSSRPTRFHKRLEPPISRMAVYHNIKRAIRRRQYDSPPSRTTITAHCIALYVTKEDLQLLRMLNRACGPVATVVSPGYRAAAVMRCGCGALVMVGRPEKGKNEDIALQPKSRAQPKIF